MRVFNFVLILALSSLIARPSHSADDRLNRFRESAKEPPIVVEIAVVAPLTSSSNSFGIPLLQSITLAADQYNSRKADRRITEKRQIHIKLNIFDDKSDPQSVPEVIDEIDKNSKAAVIVGPANSAVALKIEEKLKNDKSGLIAVTPLATATELTNENHRCDCFFRANVPDRIRLSKLINDVFDTSPSTRNLILVYEQQDVYGTGMLRDAKQLLAEVPGFSMSRVVDIPFLAIYLIDKQSRLLAIYTIPVTDLLMMQFCCWA